MHSQCAYLVLFALCHDHTQLGATLQDADLLWLTQHAIDLRASHDCVQMAAGSVEGSGRVEMAVEDTAGYA